MKVTSKPEIFIKKKINFMHGLFDFDTLAVNILTFVILSTKTISKFFYSFIDILVGNTICTLIFHTISMKLYLLTHNFLK